MGKKILFRVDSSSKIGLGHLSRCLTLASIIPSENQIYFAYLPLEGSYSNIIPNTYNKIELKVDKIESLKKIIANKNINTLIIDSYTIASEYEKELSNTCKTLAFDDQRKPHKTHGILNHNICAKRDWYPKSIDQKLFIGKDYTLIRDEFKKAKHSNTIKLPDTQRVYVSIGGTDSLNMTPKIIKLLAALDCKICVATTSANSNLDELRKISKNNNMVELFVDYKNIAALQMSCKVSIITPSVSAAEIIYLNKPLVAIKTVENQSNMARYLQEENYVVLSPKNLESLPSIVASYLSGRLNIETKPLVSGIGSKLHRLVDFITTD